MTQPLYTEQDNKELNEALESTFKMSTVDIDMSAAPGRGMTSVQTYLPETELKEQVKARGTSPFFSHIDDFAFTLSEPINPQPATQKSPPPPYDTMGHDLPFKEMLETMNQSTLLTQHDNKVRSFTEGGIEAVKNATNIIDPSTGKPIEFNLSPEMIRNAQAQLAEGGAVVLNADGSKQMFSNIKEMFEAKANKPVTERKTYFVEGKAKFHFGIDKTILEPSAIVRLSSKTFEAKYLEQLEGYIYNSQENLDPDKLFTLIYLMSIIEQKHFPIKIVTGRHRIQSPKIIRTLNLFFNKNMTVLSGISKMFNGMTVQGVQAPQSK